MKDELITFELAKLAKEIGFNEETFFYYYNNGKGIVRANNKNRLAHAHSEDNCSAPTQSLFQKWLREEYKFHFIYEIAYSDHGILYFRYKIYNSVTGLSPIGGAADTYELALGSALLETVKAIKEREH